MADSERKLRVVLEYDDKELKKGAAQSQQSMSAMTGAFVKAQLAVAALTGGFNFLVGVFKKVARAAINFVTDVGKVTYNILMLSSRANELKVALGAVGKNVGISQEQFADYEKQLRSTGISIMEARKGLLLFAQNQLDLTKITTLAATAQNLAVSAGLDSSEAFTQLTEAIIMQRPILLRQFGLVTTVDDIYKKYGKTQKQTITSMKVEGAARDTMIDRLSVASKRVEELTRKENVAESTMMSAQATVARYSRQLEEMKTVTIDVSDEMTEEAKAAAFLNYILDEGGKSLGVYDEAMGTAAKSMRSITGRVLPDMAIQLGDVVRPEWDKLVSSIYDGLRKIQSTLEPVMERLRERWIDFITTASFFWQSFMEQMSSWWDDNGKVVLEMFGRNIQSLREFILDLATGGVKDWNTFVNNAIDRTQEIIKQLALLPLYIELFLLKTQEIAIKIKNPLGIMALGIQTIIEGLLTIVTLGQLAGFQFKEAGENFDRIVKGAESIKSRVEGMAVSGAELKGIETQIEILQKAIQGRKSELEGKITPTEYYSSMYGAQHGMPNVPATGPYLLHKGERVVPKTGADVGSTTSNAVNFYGNISVRSQSDIDQIANQVARVLGRQSEIERWHG